MEQETLDTGWSLNTILTNFKRPLELSDWCVRYSALVFLVLPTALPWPQYTILLVVIVALGGNRWPTTRYAMALLALVMLVHLFGFVWSAVDNHRFLFVYWTFAMAIVTWLPIEQREAAIRGNARALLCLSFAAAAIAKLLSLEFMDGTLLTHLLLTKNRMVSFAEFVGISAADRAAYAANLARESFPSCFTTSQNCLFSVPTNRWTLLFSWVAVAFEALIALAFALFSWVPGLAHASLLLFILVTYYFVPVHEFGFVLTAIGLGAAVYSPAWSRAYLVAAVVVSLFKVW